MTDEVRQIVVHPAAWDLMVELTRAAGFRLGRIPGDEDTYGLPTYVMVPDTLEEPT